MNGKDAHQRLRCTIVGSGWARGPSGSLPGCSTDNAQLAVSVTVADGAAMSAVVKLTPSKRTSNY